MPLPLSDTWQRGSLLGEADLAFLREEDSFVRGREWAASRLARREDSTGRMEQKLLQRGYNPGVIRRIIDEMVALGFLDDRRFAGLWLADRLRHHPEGREALLGGLLKRGVPSSVSREVLGRLVSDRDCEVALERALETLRAQGDLSEEKLIRRLLRRGFSYLAIKGKLN